MVAKSEFFSLNGQCWLDRVKWERREKPLTAGSFPFQPFYRQKSLGADGNLIKRKMEIVLEAKSVKSKTIPQIPL